MPETSTVLDPETTSTMMPVRPTARIEIVDVLRGFALLGVLMMNMGSFSGAPPLAQTTGLSRIAVLFITFFAQAKFYTMFSFLFGWGMSIQMERAAQRGSRFAPLYARRLLVLLLIGLVHAVLIWSGDILTIYALLGFFLLLFRSSSPKVLLIAVIVCLLIPVLVSIPGPGQAFRTAYAQATASWHIVDRDPADVFATGNYWEVTQHRWQSTITGYSYAVYWATHILAMFLLGLYVGRRRIFHDVSQHLPLFRKVMWVGLVVGGALNALFVYATVSPDSIPGGYMQLATRGARTVGSSLLCLAYVSIIVLLYQQQGWREKLTPLGGVGRMALTNYLTHSVVCTLIFYGYGLGLYGKFSPAITLILTLVIYQAQIRLSDWWLYKYRFGPAEWLWRSLTYGKFQSLVPEWRHKLQERQKQVSTSKGEHNV